MGLGGTAAYLTAATTTAELIEASNWATDKQLPVLVIGDGSNIVWRDEGFAGLVIVNAITGYKLQELDATSAYLTVGAGENWDSVVARSVEAGLTGIEALSLIPGTAGATPIQNVGAYGQEIAQTLTTVEAYDSQTRQMVVLRGSDCAFGYRTSRFKTTDRGRYFITAITLQLQRGKPPAPYYNSVQAYFEQHGINTVTPAVLRDTVVAIRTARLPDPKTVRNNGSFFGNPIVSGEQLLTLRAAYPEAPGWTLADGSVKIPAAWLIQQAGFADYHDDQTGMATWHTQPLVLVNEHATSTAQLLTFKKKIVDTVQAKFGIELTQEPELLP